MLDSADARAKAVRSIVEDVRRGDDADPFGDLNPLDIKFFRSARVALHIPHVDPVVCRRVMVFLMDELPNLVAEMDRCKDRRSKSLLAHGRLQAWNHAFARWAKGGRK